MPGKSKAKSKFNGLFLYTGGILFHVEWCIRQLWHSYWHSYIILCHVTSIAHDQY